MPPVMPPTGSRRIARAALLLLLLLAPPLAGAHAPQPADAPVAAIGWSFEPWVLACLGASLLLYAAGLFRLWRKAGAGRGLGMARAASFGAGWLALVVALVSPLDALGGHLFSAHMVQHEVLMILAAPLLVIGRPLAVWTWALHGLALWVWHLPPFFEAALQSPGVHTLQHASFLVTALLFWWPPLGGASRAGHGSSMLYLFTTMVHTGALGALLTFSTVPWYPAYGASTPALGFDLLEDQRLGGLIMWVPAGLAYLVVALAAAARLLQGDAPAHSAPGAMPPR